jgi:hypothetical protein
MISGKPFFIPARRRLIIRKIILPLAIVYTGLFVAATLRDMTIRDNEYAAVLLSDYAITEYDYWASPSAFLGSYIPWTFYFNNRGLRVKWFLRAKGADLRKVIRDPGCQSIVLVGHGSRNNWQATDGEVSNMEVENVVHGLRKKTGEWFQLTCGTEDFTPVRMGKLVMDQKHVYTYDGAVTFYYFVTDALSAFSYLKCLKR